MPGRWLSARAWLVTWEGTKTPEKRVVAAFNPRIPASRIRKVVQVLYVTLVEADADKIRFGVVPKRNPYPAREDMLGNIECGHNPWLRARIVSNLREAGGEVRWTEAPSVRERWKQIAELHGRDAVPESLRYLLD